MLRFDVGSGVFNYRSAAVIISDGHILLHKSVKDDFWALPGGRVELFESSEDTISRELMEELGLGARVIRLLWHVESFYDYSDKKYHEVANYFLTEFSKAPSVFTERDFLGIEAELDLVFRWVPVNKLPEYKLMPEFLVNSIQNIPEGIEYLSVRE